MSIETPTAHILGAGPAGLSAAYELARRGVRPIVLEKSPHVGGISRTETYKGYRFDIGGHRFYTQVEEIRRLWESVGGAHFRRVARLSRIYYAGKFFHYPLNLFQTLWQLGALESVRILLSYIRARLFPMPHENTFEEWVTNRFGSRLYQMFFKTYTEKVWGIPCNEIQAEWAAQRIQGLSLVSAVTKALLPRRGGAVKTLIEEFAYPTHGPGMMWELFEADIEAHGGEVCREIEITRLKHDNVRITAIIGRSGLHDTGENAYETPVDHVISTMALDQLIAALDPPPPAEVLKAARGLKYRDFLTVSLIVNREHVFADNWIYIHAPHIQVGRIQNFKNWSVDMVPDARTTSLGMEYFCNVGDALWAMDDAALIALAAAELELLGLGARSDVTDGVVIRQRKAYPVYDGAYREHVAVIRAYLSGFGNLQTAGRNGLHRYNNQDHSMLTGLMAARNILGETNDIWAVNTERSYYEDFVTKPDGA